MVSFLLLLGVTLLGVATVWMIEHASHRGVAGWRLLLPFGAGAYVREYWQDVRFVAMGRVLGFVLMLVGVGVAIAHNPRLLAQPALFWQGNVDQVTQGSTEAGMNEFMATKQKALLAMRGDNSGNLAGKLHGQPFTYQRVELIDGVLGIRQGKGFLPDLEVRILLNLDPTGMTDRRSFYVQPTDQNPPLVYLSWRDAKGELQTRIISHGYSLELQLAPLTAYRLNGFLQLILPGEAESYLTGNFIAETNHLHYIGDQVDIAYDDPDTLKYVATDYLTGQERQGAVRSIVVDQVNMDLDNGVGNVSATVLLSNNQLESHQLKLQRADFGWQVVAGSDQVTVLRAASDVRDAAASDNAPAAHKKAPKQIPAADIASYAGQSVTLMRSDGSTEAGIIRGFDKRGVQVEEQIAAGSVQYHIDPATISQITLSNGQVLLLQGGAPAPTATAPTATTTTPTATTPAAPSAPAAQSTAPAQSAADTATQVDVGSYRKWLKKQVVITGTDGKQRQGTLSGVDTDQLTLTVSMGAGSMQFFYKPGDIKSVEPLKN